MKKRSKLSFEEYQIIYEKKSLGWGVNETGRYLGRSGSSVSRLLSRRYDICSGVWKEMTPFEQAKYAWDEYKKLCRQCRRRLRLKNRRIRRLVIYLITRRHWSPEPISRFLTRYGLKISAKAIYNFIKKERATLVKYLTHRGKPRRQRIAHPRGFLKSGAPKKRSIHEREEVIEAGHWEIDTIHSKKGSKSAVLTIKEMVSQRSFFFLLADKKAETVRALVLPFFQRLPSHLCKSITGDNGSEFEELYKLEKAVSGMKVYFCDAYKSYQKGGVENSNLDLRWYLPKGTDFSDVSASELRSYEYKINSKPRYTLIDFSPIKLFQLYSAV